MKKLLFITTMILLANTLTAGGLLLSNNEDYPGRLLRNKTMAIDVKINNYFAETIVYEEFINDWDETVDAVYSFPLPDGARTVLLLYWSGDTTYKAVLQVKQQDINPGTGEGGIAAEVNEYIGRNGIRLQLRDIEPGEIQKVELRYISNLDYHKGTAYYSLPVNTSQFLDYPIDIFAFNINVESSKTITGFDVPSHPDYSVDVSGEHQIQLSYEKSKKYLTSDLAFEYTAASEDVSVNFETEFIDTLGGHFNLFVTSPNEVDESEIIHRNVVFLLENSSKMFGIKLQQSKDAIINALDLLNEMDSFNIITFNQLINEWQPNLVPATETNKTSAITFLEDVIAQYGTNLQNALSTSLSQFTSDTLNNSIILFSGGRSDVDPVNIASNNNFDTGIFAIGLGDDVDREKLEFISQLNYGFVTYFDVTDNVQQGIGRVIEKISTPIIKDVAIDFSKDDIHQKIPATYPSIFAGSYSYIVGRYDEGGNSDITITGNTTGEEFISNYQVTFNSGYQSNFSDKLWAKEKIDQLERYIETYGEDDALKDSLIELSLTYEIKCKYTAYIADYEEEYDLTGVKETDELLPVSYSLIAQNYPNPFNATTTFRFFVSEKDAGRAVLLKIYNILGELVAVIDLSNYSSGWHQIVFNGKDGFGNVLPSGVYIVSMQVGNKIVNSVKINLLK
ncbi:MAG: VWA domain-containing protein [Melioribacteraceae bacterium]|nr:VWA domain-containing protein [Melioribacteraceae bacterium]MCF8357097.1 VWA domain-containing protein [Melioribacteraceae bacterium]MCF8393775.1 VWA domain-containing protein [Melioribacteraceae bacterium]MCF8419519.1 VWA domain-containing protein [Melioribacteraceae bacterium]